LSIRHDKQEFSTNLRQTLQQTALLPVLPETARKIIELRNKPDANIEQLVHIIESDPALAAFVMKYARLAIFGYSDRITSVEHAVSLVLGYTTALNVTMGVATAGCLEIPKQGPLGLIRIWSEALECALLCRELCKHTAKKQIVDSGLAYLGGLLHNIGYIIFGHLRPKEFASLNKLVACYPKYDIRTLEMQRFGITHDTIGMYLLKAWNLPEEVAVIVAEHHFPDYAGEYAVYVKLVATANRLLQKDGMLDACPYVETSVLLEDLGISKLEAETALYQVQACQSEFNTLAQELAA
jgi:putative nucleotidyltransferase with HDIG domain